MSSLGTIVWHDLTVDNAPQIRDFYASVVGWQADACNMGDYDDYVMLSPLNEGATGICHARGENANIPPQWLMYVTVANVAQSIEQCLALGGSVVDGPRAMGKQQFCVIRDPAGAVIAIIGE